MYFIDFFFFFLAFFIIRITNLYGLGFFGFYGKHKKQIEITLKQKSISYSGSSLANVPRAPGQLQIQIWNVFFYYFF